MSDSVFAKKFILKIPGSAFSPEGKIPVEKQGTNWIAKEITSLIKAGFQPITILGSSNLWSGKTAPDAGIGQVSSDMMGMLATIANALALRDALLTEGGDPRLFTSLRCDQAAAPYIRGKVVSAINKNKAVVLAGGTGTPFFRADTAAALRASELGCSYILRATPKAEFNNIKEKLKHNPTAENALNLGLFDSTAMAFCRENHTTLVLFEANKEGAALDAINGRGELFVIKPN